MKNLYHLFGEGVIPQTSTEKNPSNILFNSIGNKEITVTIDRDGCSNIITKTIVVKEIMSGKNKIKICHNGNSIIINENALQAHLNHGDCIGECNINNSLKNETIENESNIEIIYNDIKNYIEINSKIEEENAIFEIYDNTGKLISTKFIGNIKIGNSSFNIENLSTGIYYGIIKISNEQKTISIIIK